ncbi:MAG: GAF domain-containing protein [candidate division NC10 bacterium]|nr:GAF domain-containing protein [candidate division NC10 bacterium]
MEKTETPGQERELHLAWRKFQNLIETVSSSLDLKEIIQRLADGVVSGLGYPACYVNLYHPEEDTLSIVGFAPRGKLLTAAEKMLNLHVDTIRFPILRADKGSTYARIFRGEEFVIKEYSELVSPRIPESVAHASQKIFGINSILVMPLRSKEDLLGVFLVGNSENDFSADEWETLRIVSRHASIAMEKALLYEASDAAKREAEAMAEIAQDLSASLDLRSTLRKIISYARRLCQADLSVIALYHKEHGYAIITDYEGARTDVYKDMRIYPGKGIGGKVLETGRVWVTDDFLNDPRFSRDYHREAKAEGIRCNMAVPIFSQQEIAGILWVVNRTPSPFKAPQQRVLQKLSAHAGIAILNAKLFEESKEALHRQRSLVEIVAAINAQLDPKEILRIISRSAAEFCHGDAAAIFDVSEEGYLALQGGYNLSPDFARAVEEARITPEEAAISKTVISGFPVEVFDPSIEPVLSPKVLGLLKKEGLQSFITMSLGRKGKETGALTVFLRRLQHFGSQELNLLNTLTHHAAVALERNFLYQEMEARNIRLSLLSEIAKAIGSTLDAQEIFRSMLSQLDRILPFQRVTLYLFQADTDSFLLRCLYEKQSPSQPLGRTEMLASETPASIAFFAKKPFLVKDTRESDLAIIQELKELSACGFLSVLYIPILTDDSCMGVLGLAGVQSPGFHKHQIDLLSDLSPYLALALKNADLYGELKKTLEELEKAQQQILQAEKLKALGEMASGIAHDFNNLLATILVRAELLERRATEPELQEWARVIQKTALDGAETVRRLRSFYKKESDAEQVPLDINQVIQEVIRRTEPRWKDQARGSGISIQIETDLQPVVPILGNPAELRDVFTNLIFNAIDALSQGGQIRISSRLLDQGLPTECVQVTLADDGIGMSDEVLERAFDPFFTTKGTKGSGLGLSVSYGIIKRHQGEITIQSHLNQGTTVLIRLPSTKASPERKRASTAELDLSPLRILVIEDEKELAEGLQRMLSLFGHQVDTALSGKEGLLRFSEGNYELIFTDMGMADLTGTEVAKSIKEKNPSLPVLLVTGWGDQLDSSQVKEYGIDAVIAKPFRIGDILEAIHDTLSRYR